MAAPWGTAVTLFVLLHGGLHNGSSWDLVATYLSARGHDVVAPDLPVDDDAAGAVEWAQVASAAIDGATNRADSPDIVAVAHSISGLCLPVLAAMRPVRKMVFVAALIPVPGETFAAQFAANPHALSFPAPTATGAGPFGLTWESVREGFYHDCPEELARETFRTLRHQSFTVFTERCPLDRWPDTPSTYVLMKDDRAVDVTWARDIASERFGTEIIELDGGHSPFLAQPSELSAVLSGIALSA